VFKKNQKWAGRKKDDSFSQPMFLKMQPNNLFYSRVFVQLGHQTFFLVAILFAIGIDLSDRLVLL